MNTDNNTGIIIFVTGMLISAILMTLLYRAARERGRSGYWLFWGLNAISGVIALIILLRKAKLTSEEQEQGRAKASVPVGLATILGFLMLPVGIGNLFSSADPGNNPSDKAFEILLGRILLLAGATLAGGGVFVFLAERKVRTLTSTQTPEKLRTPKWAYVFVGICGILLAGGVIGAACGLVGASSCVAFSRNQKLSVPRRIYACILTSGVAWVSYFAWASLFLSVINSAKH